MSININHYAIEKQSFLVKAAAAVMAKGLQNLLLCIQIAKAAWIKIFCQPDNTTTIIIVNTIILNLLTLNKGFNLHKQKYYAFTSWYKLHLFIATQY